ncbi:MAG: hypothetical protein L0177_18200 [Chloroflexi bacterium]|nr:hypothetical protein [Chloroflexota bacterium]
MTSLSEAASAIQAFQQGDLGGRIAALESLLQGGDAAKLEAAFPLLGINSGLLDAALILKAAAGQVNVLIHAVGILLAIPKILTEGEQLISLSLGAGSTGKPFDLETTVRICEFKFIEWKGGAEAIRQNSLFKDFFLLAEYETAKLKQLYVIGTEHPLRFLQGGRALSSVMSRNNKLWQEFQGRYGQKFSTVSEYYNFRKAEVALLDITDVLPALKQSSVAAEEDASL